MSTSPHQPPRTPSGNVVTTFTERTFHEQETVNPGETGRVLLGEDFRYNTNQTFDFDLPGRVPNTEVRVYTSFAAKTANQGSSFTFKANGTNVPAATNDQISQVSDMQHQHYFVGNFSKRLNDLGDATKLAWNINYSSGGTIYLARLNYITVNYTRNLALSGSEVAWGLVANDPMSFAVSGAQRWHHGVGRDNPLESHRHAGTHQRWQCNLR